MAYESLAKLFYRDPSPERFSRNEALAHERRNADSTFRTGVQSPYGEFFLAMPRELQSQRVRVPCWAWINTGGQPLGKRVPCCQKP